MLATPNVSEGHHAKSKIQQALELAGPRGCSGRERQANPAGLSGLPTPARVDRGARAWAARRGPAAGLGESQTLAAAARRTPRGRALPFVRAWVPRHRHAGAARSLAGDCLPVSWPLVRRPGFSGSCPRGSKNFFCRAAPPVEGGLFARVGNRHEDKLLKRRPAPALSCFASHRSRTPLRWNTPGSVSLSRTRSQTAISLTRGVRTAPAIKGSSLSESEDVMLTNRNPAGQGFISSYSVTHIRRRLLRGSLTPGETIGDSQQSMSPLEGRGQLADPGQGIFLLSLLRLDLGDTAERLASPPAVFEQLSCPHRRFDLTSLGLFIGNVCENAGTPIAIGLGRLKCSLDCSGMTIGLLTSQSGQLLHRETCQRSILVAGRTFCKSPTPASVTLVPARLSVDRLLSVAMFSTPHPSPWCPPGKGWTGSQRWRCPSTPRPSPWSRLGKASTVS
jgi:hypothetical protein